VRDDRAESEESGGISQPDAAPADQSALVRFENQVVADSMNKTDHLDLAGQVGTSRRWRQSAPNKPPSALELPAAGAAVAQLAEAVRRAGLDALAVALQALSLADRAALTAKLLG
jgi:hypothetical protein